MTDEDLDALERAMASAGGMTAAFTEELGQMRRALGATTRDLGTLERGFSRGLQRALNGVVVGGDRMAEVLHGLAGSMVKTVHAAATKPVTDHVGGLLAQGLNGLVSGLMPHARGGALAGGRTVPFARGGVVTGPVAFPMRGGTGLMGEAGPEAIMPLTRGPDGSLGVAAQGGARPVQVTINVSSPDVAGFRRSQGQIAAEVARAVTRGARNR
ncbi:phage tail tape measure protein [Pseudoroseicyclus aestuarii]|uniref:Lambda family phage tail tape measure protein n=1 Tax=Pseudoroseicyclus aestuarii TaxID=1795041 RepID=A0A318SUY4_9RHOB|nr:phage tail tape measure protein [Pseudoroseicyclus aestuarii]PYE85721.1 lambda family phage tail tape measure protein [Pseudoroseicyclus aestuarii]